MLEDGCNLSDGVAGFSHVDRQWGCLSGSLGGRIKPISKLAHLYIRRHVGWIAPSAIIVVS